MSLTRLAIRYRPVTYVLLASILALGLLAIVSLSRREDPDLQGRFVQIIALYPGATAQQVEEPVTDRLERTLLELDDIKTVTSTSRPGIAVLRAEVADRARDLKKFRDELRDRIGDLRPDLPSGVLSVDVNDRFADTAALIVGVTQDAATDRQRETLAKKVRDRLRTLPDVAQVDLVGEQQERITITLSAQRMAQLSITPAQVAQAIAQRNVLPSTGGSVALGSVRFAIEPTGNLNGTKELENLVVANFSDPVYLRDIATVTRGYADPSPYLFRVNGQPAVGVSVTMRRGFNITALGEEVRREFARLRAEMPAGARITLINDLPRSVVGRMAEFYENLIAGVLLIVVVLYLFMGLRSAMIVAVMLPITIVGTFALMYLFGHDIQQISITALIVALGLVVDNSIVVVDNIERKLSQGIEPERAAIEGTDELRVPLLTSNLTTVASFAPILLLSGGVGEFIRDLGVVTSLATLISLLLNYTVAPLIAIRYLKGEREEQPNRLRRFFLAGVDRLRDAISWLAARGIRRARLTVGLAFAGVILAVGVIPRLGTQFFPSAVRSQFTIDVFLPEGRDIRATLHTAEKVEQIVRARPGIVSYATYVGQGGPRFYYNVSPEPPEPNYAQIVVNTEDAEQTRPLIPAIQAAADARIPEARVTVRSLEQGPAVGAPIAVRISGEAIADLRRTGETVKAILNETPGAASVYQDYDEVPLALKVNVDEEQAKLAGLSAAEIAQATQMGFSGLTASFLREGDKEIPIQLRFEPAERSGPQSLADMYLPSSTGAAVALRQVATISLAPQEGKIVRRNHVRTLTVLAFTDGTRLASQILADARMRIAALPLPPGVQITYGGEQEEVGRSFTELLLILGLTVAANLIIVLAEFNSFRAGLTILMAVPFSMTGAILGLFLMRLPFGFVAFLGLTALGGVVTNHAIVLFEYALAEQREGVAMDQALLDAGRRRLRPILLTVLLSIFGVLPEGLHGGTLWPPLAWSLIFGLLMSLVLTLVIVPSFYKTISGGGRQPGEDEASGWRQAGSSIPTSFTRVDTG
jgi:multidrug efflux pump subunit AcrB